MNRLNFSGGTGFKGLLAGCLMAGALSLAFSEGTSGTHDKSTDQSQAEQSGTDQYGGTSQSPTGETGTGTVGGTGQGQTGQTGTGQVQTGTGADAGMTTPSGAATILPPNVTPGWKIRVCSEKTKTSNINFKISPADKDSKKESKGKTSAPGAAGTGSTDQMGATGMETTGAATEQTAMWSRGEPTLISLPTEVRDVDKLRIEAIPAEKDQKASVCVLYNDHVVKKMNFDERSVSTIRKTENAECGC